MAQCFDTNYKVKHGPIFERFDIMSQCVPMHNLYFVLVDCDAVTRIINTTLHIRIFTV